MLIADPGYPGVTSSLAGDPYAATLASNLNANEGALQRDGGAIPIDSSIARGGGEALFGAFLGFFGARNVDFFGALGKFRKNGDAIPQDFGETTDDGKGCGLARAHRAIGEFADAE